MIVYLARAIQAFVMYCVNGTSRSSLLIESTDSMIESTDSMINIIIIIIVIIIIIIIINNNTQIAAIALPIRVLEHDRLNEFQQYQATYVELAFARPIALL